MIQGAMWMVCMGGKITLNQRVVGSSPTSPTILSKICFEISAKCDGSKHRPAGQSRAPFSKQEGSANYLLSHYLKQFG